MEWRILILGAVGAGKTEAIRTISDIDVVDTEELATDDTALLKANTTVAMDMGVMQLGEEDRVILYGAPGQERFDFMWEILFEQSRGVVLLIDDSRDQPLDLLGNYIRAIRKIAPNTRMPLIVGVTHTDVTGRPSIEPYRAYLREHACDLGGSRIPVFRTDARRRRDVRNLLLALTAILEHEHRKMA